MRENIWVWGLIRNPCASLLSLNVVACFVLNESGILSLKIYSVFFTCVSNMTLELTVCMSADKRLLSQHLSVRASFMFPALIVCLYHWPLVTNKHCCLFSLTQQHTSTLQNKPSDSWWGFSAVRRRRSPAEFILMRILPQTCKSLHLEPHAERLQREKAAVKTIFLSCSRASRCYLKLEWDWL